MSPSADVRSIQALEDLRAALPRFSSEVQESLNATALEIRRTLDWLTERQGYWQAEARRRQEMLAKANAALAACRASRYRDPKTGAYHEPPCTAQWEAVRKVQVYLAEAEAELRNVQQWMRLVEQAAAEYQRQAQRLAARLGNDLPKATELLDRKITTLQSYVAGPATSGGTGMPTSASTTFSTTPPTQAVANMFTTGVGSAALNAELTGAAIAVIRWLAGDVRQALGSVGEQLSARLLSEQFELQELPFNQPKHGFDRVFSAPGLPIIVMESKVTQSGQFHPAETKHGIQGSPDWVAAQAEKMGDPKSAQWSPANQRIAALVQELGVENVPAVAVAIQSDTGMANVYYRAAGAEEWQPLGEGVSLADALATASPSGAHLETSGNLEREPGAEFIEGPRGGPKRGG